MKKFSCIIFALIFIVLSVTVYAAQGDVMINEDFTITVESEKEKDAADTFAGYIKGATGIDVPVVIGSAESPFIALSVDDNAAEGYTIENVGDNIEIKGSDFAQLVRGMYAFLEKFGGVRYYTSEGVTYTQNRIPVPEGTKYKYTPYFEYTDTDWLSPKDTQYSLFNGLNSAEYRNIPDKLGGCIDYISSFAHTLTTQFCSSAKYYEEHPEYFALYRGIRTDSQLCLTNPDVLKIVTDEVLELLRQKHDSTVPLQIVSLTQNDNIFFCTCSKCREVDRKCGSHAGTMIQFANAVARKVKEAGYDNVAIDTFAYRYTRTPPKGIAPEDNVIVRLCSIECCFSHPLDDETCKANKEFMKDLKGWSEICKRIYIWDYCTNYCNWVGLFPDFSVLQRNMQIFYESNVKGIYEEGNYAMDAEGEFGELRSWLIGQLYKNPYMDYDAAIKEFCDAYYGEGGKYVKSFLDKITENEKSLHLGIYQSMKDTLRFNLKDIEECDKLWENAENAATGKALEHVKGSEIAWRWWKMKNRVSEFGNPFEYKDVKATLLDDISAKGIKDLAEMSDVKAFFCEIYQGLFFKIYYTIDLVLKILYS